MTWALEPPPGFQGLHPDKPVSLFKRRLPHWRQPGASYFVTFRLADSLPESKLQELRWLRDKWERENPEPRSSALWQELWRDSYARVSHWLDEGAGACHLRDPRGGKIVADPLVHFHGERYELGCAVVMPNHVHAIVRPFDEDNEALARIMHSWKRHSARATNALLGRTRGGPLWQRESYDRIIRDAGHLWRTLQYIGHNPAKAGLRPRESTLWLSPVWEALGWRFET